ncbi:hypothetical protein LTS16_006758 [Friedmanniomyces endolithicus]|uniref:Uncharacterized protein n=1 Tax=Friedmanniomyces endolithicus TaxID=329885 RepID=A0AAN6J9M3_9PEZI|nr:hypothetical protein LTS09_010972 [Friedmanniomyces endolithicus]KAK0284593.1 hypothetical protein LTR35_005505 [Friedmanniomyces endolithicus]KAK0297535.1 hypothetical protein LTS00_003666 [Friedmanniomyces endolithicus]KAK0321985.1 hypothetical protein LTR82_006958 [Friedmanniomyces endolithicus]KAK0930817.1 hypothetical protein LTR57_001199 [Friedmanniomyces endolithicus]
MYPWSTQKAQTWYLAMWNVQRYVAASSTVPALAFRCRAVRGRRGGISPEASRLARGAKVAVTGRSDKSDPTDPRMWSTRLGGSLLPSLPESLE